MITTSDETTLTSLEDVRLAVLRQHTQLAQLLDELEASANGVLANTESPSRMSDAIRILHTRFTRHLAFEEANLAPIVERFTSGPAEVQSMRDEHVEQRAQIDGLLHDAAVFGDPSSFAREALAFVHAIRRDMVAEELWLRGIG